MNPDTITLTCPICSKTYTAKRGRLKWGRHKTCSLACSYILRGQKLERKVSFICPVCQTEFTRSPSHIKGKHGNHFCSRACHYAGRGLSLTKRIVSQPYVISPEGREAWRRGAEKTHQIRIARDNYKHTEATRAKLSETTAKAIAEGKMGRVSKLEDIVAVELDKLGISYIRQFAIRNKLGRFTHVLDFWLPKHKTAIEVNGTFWHADPRVYAIPFKPAQIRNFARYQTKRESLKRLGIRIIEVWEADIESDPSQAVLEACARLRRC